MVLKGMATFFHQYLGDMFGIKSVYRLRNGLYEKLQRLSFSYYDNAKTGDLMSRLTADVEGLVFSLSYGLAELIRFGLLVAISLSVMFYYSVPLTLVTIAVLPFLAVAVYRFDKRVHPASEASANRLRNSIQKFRKISAALIRLNLFPGKIFRSALSIKPMQNTGRSIYKHHPSGLRISL